MPEGARKLTAFPHQLLLADEAFSGVVGELDLLEHLGPTTAETDPGTDDPCLYWDTLWDCGLVMSLEFHQLSEVVHVYLDALDYDHALRHLDGELTDLVLLPQTDYVRYRELWIDEPEREWTLWRTMPDGEEIEEAWGLTERDASCRCASSDESDPAQGTLRVVHGRDRAWPDDQS